MAEKITVTTGSLAKKQEEWHSLFKQIETEFTEIGGLLNKLEQYFWGSPVDIIKSSGLKKQEEGAVCLKQLGTHVEKLSEINAVYEQAERSNQDVITDD